MELKENKIADALVVSIVGRLDTPAALVVEKSINQRIDDGERLIVLNLSKLEYMSSSGLRLFIGLAKRLKSAGGAFAISSVPESQQELIQLTQINRVVPIFESDGDAVIAISKSK